MKTKTFQIRNTIVLVALSCLLPVIAKAHVSVWPRESNAGATEKYTVRVPTEGKSVELEVPEGVIVETMASPAGWKYEATRKDDRIVSIR